MVVYHHKKHGIDSLKDHNGVSGAVTDNIVTFDANELPVRDGGVSISDVLTTIPFEGLYYVSESGSDVTGTGSIDKPWKTYQHAHDVTTGIVYLFILDPGNIADQNLSVGNSRGVSIFNPIGLGPYSSGEITNLTMGTESTFVGHNINVITSIVGPATTWADVYFDGGGIVSPITTGNVSKCIFWFDRTLLKPETYSYFLANSAGISGTMELRDTFAPAYNLGLDATHGRYVDFNYGYSLTPKTLLWSTVNTRFQFNDRVYAPYFYGDGSNLTNITAEALNLSPDEWLYFNYPTNTIGIRYASPTTSPPTGQVETNWKFYAPNIYSGNAVSGQNFYSMYHVCGDNSYSPGIANQIMYWLNVTTHKVAASMSKDGDLTFWDANVNNPYISWKNNASPTPVTMGGFGFYDNAGSYELEIYTRNSTTDPIQMYSTTNLWEDTALQDGKYLFFDTARTKSLWYDGVTNNRFEFNDALYISGTMTIGAYTLPNTDGSANYVLKTDGAGVVTWQADTAGTNYWTQTLGVLHPATSTDSIGIANLESIDFNYGATAKTLLYDATTNNRFEFNDKVYAPGARIGSDTDYTEFAADGFQTMVGDAQVWKTVHFNTTTGYVFRPYAATLGGETYTAASIYTLGPYSLAGFVDTVAGADVGNSIALHWIIPQDAVGGASSVRLRIHAAQDNNTGTGNVRVVYGYRQAADGTTIVQAVSTDGSQVKAVPGVAYGKFSDVYTYALSVAKGDSIVFVIGRDGEDATDTYASPIYMSDIEVEYLSDRVGA